MRRRRRPSGPIVADGPDRFRLVLDVEEMSLLRRLLDQLRGLLTGAPHDDARVRRLFPTAYHDDPERDGEYQRFMRDELVASRLAALTEVDSTLEHGVLSMDQLAAFMRSLNALRLVLGTLLDVDEDTDPMRLDPQDPLFAEHQLYLWLSWMLEHVVEALGHGLA